MNLGVGYGRVVNYIDIPDPEKKPKKRMSVIKRLREKQIAIAKRSGKPLPKYLEQQMVREKI